MLVQTLHKKDQEGNTSTGQGAQHHQAPRPTREEAAAHPPALSRLGSVEFNILLATNSRNTANSCLPLRHTQAHSSFGPNNVKTAPRRHQPQGPEETGCDPHAVDSIRNTRDTDTAKRYLECGRRRPRGGLKSGAGGQAGAQAGRSLTAEGPQCVPGSVLVPGWLRCLSPTASLPSVNWISAGGHKTVPATRLGARAQFCFCLGVCDQCVSL